MDDHIIISNDDYLGCVKVNGVYLYYYGMLYEWVVDQVSYTGMTELSDGTEGSDIYLTRFEKQIPFEQVPKVSHYSSPLSSAPITFFVDFDNQIFVSGWHDNIALHNHVPEGWQGIEGNPYEFLPKRHTPDKIFGLRTTDYWFRQYLQLPDKGNHILAQYDDENIIMYQAFRSDISNAITMNKNFLIPGFHLNRTSWIKPSFLWMMYRSGWATKLNQESILAIWVNLDFFNELLHKAVHSHYVPHIYVDQEVWRQELSASEVILQWDPDRDRRGNKLKRRVIQLGLRGGILQKYASGKWIQEIRDITRFVHKQNRLQNPLVLSERVYPVEDPLLTKKLMLDNS